MRPSCFLLTSRPLVPIPLADLRPIAFSADSVLEREFISADLSVRNLARTHALRSIEYDYV